MFVVKPLSRQHLKSFRKRRLEALKHYPQFFPVSYESEKKISLTEYWNILQERNAIGIFDKQKLVGFSGFVNIEGKEKECEISATYVEEDYRGQGLARLLINEVIKEVGEKNYEKIYVSHSTQNKAAAKSYKRLGFQKTFTKMEKFASTQSWVNVVYYHIHLNKPVVQFTDL
jgi:ribosomal protein S18 acetylase RimI-like enzyme